MEQSLRPVGQTLSDMFNSFSGKGIRSITEGISELNEGQDETLKGVETTNTLLTDETNRIIEAIEGMNVNTASKSIDVRQGIDQLVGSMFRIGNLTENQSWLLEELKNTNAEAVVSDRQAWEDLATAVQFLGENGIDNQTFIDSLKNLDSAIRDEKILRELQMMNDGFEQDRIDEMNDKKRGGGTSPSQTGEEEGGGGSFMDTIMGFLGMGGMVGKRGLKGILGGAKRLLGKLGPWAVAISSVFDFVQGFNSAAEIIGKSEDEIDTFDKVTAGLSNILSGLTFGLVDADKIYKFYSEGMQDAFSNTIGYLVELLSFGFLDGSSAKEVAHEMYGDFVNFFRDYVNGFVDNVTKSAQGALDVFVDVLKSIPKRMHNTVLGIFDVISDIMSVESFDDVLGVVGKITDGFASLFGEDGFLYKVLEWVNHVTNMLTGGLFDVIGGGLNNLGGTAIDAIADSGFGKAIGSAVDWFSGDDKAPETPVTANTVQRQPVMSIAPATMSMAMEPSKKRYEEMMSSQNQQPPTVIVKNPPMSTPQEQPTRRRKLGSMGLDLINSGALD